MSDSPDPLTAARSTLAALEHVVVERRDTAAAVAANMTRKAIEEGGEPCAARDLSIAERAFHVPAAERRALEAREQLRVLLKGMN